MGMTLGEKIRNLRKEKGLSLDKLAEMTDTSKSYLWELENRNSRNPTKDKLIKISQALGVTTNYLTDEDSELDSAVLEKAFFRKFKSLDEDDQEKIKQIVDLWGKKD